MTQNSSTTPTAHAKTPSTTSQRGPTARPTSSSRTAARRSRRRTAGWRRAGRRAGPGPRRAAGPARTTDGGQRAAPGRRRPGAAGVRPAPAAADEQHQDDGQRAGLDGGGRPGRRCGAPDGVQDDGQTDAVASSGQTRAPRRSGTAVDEQAEVGRGRRHGGQHQVGGEQHPGRRHDALRAGSGRRDRRGYLHGGLQDGLEGWPDRRAKRRTDGGREWVEGGPIRQGRPRVLSGSDVAKRARTSGREWLCSPHTPDTARRLATSSQELCLAVRHATYRSVRGRPLSPEPTRAVGVDTTIAHLEPGIEPESTDAVGEVGWRTVIAVTVPRYFLSRPPRTRGGQPLSVKSGPQTVLCVVVQGAGYENTCRIITTTADEAIQSESGVSPTV